MTKYRRLNGLNATICFSPFGSLEVQDQGASAGRLSVRAFFWLCPYMASPGCNYTETLPLSLRALIPVMGFYSPDFYN